MEQSKEIRHYHHIGSDEELRSSYAFLRKMERTGQIEVLPKQNYLTGGVQMFVLEYKQLHIVKEPMRKNCTCQSYLWKQYAMCDDRQPLQDFIDKQPRPDEWRIEEYPN